jgi:hypothetical protein
MAGVASLGILLSRRIREVSNNIESMPGVSDDTILSFQRLQLGVEKTSGVMNKAVTFLGEGFESMFGLARFGFIMMSKGLAEAQADLIEVDKTARAAAFARSGGPESEKALSDARKTFSLLRTREGVGESIMRRRQEAEAIEKEANSISNAIQKNKKLTESVTLRTQAERDLMNLEKEFNKAQSEVASGTADIDRAYSSATKSLKQLNDERKEISIKLGKSNMAFLSGDLTAMEESIELNKQLKEIDEDRLRIIRKNKDVFREAGEMLANGFEEAVFSGEKLSKVIKQLGMDIMRLVFRQTITAPLADFFTGGISKIFGGPRANGGPVGANKSYLVGERGPEIFTPSSAGNVISNRNSFGGGSGGGSTYYIDARGADQTGLARLESMIRQTQASIVPMALGAVMNAKARGSAFYA